MVSHVLQVDRSDIQGLVLLNIQSGARDELDVVIEATEGTKPYATRLKRHQIELALSKASSLSDEQWDIVARSLLLQKRPRIPEHVEVLQGIELSAQVFDDKLVLAFRKNISGIHQRLAELTIPKDEDHELDTIAWVSTASQRATRLESEVRALEAKNLAHLEAIRRLEEQLEQLMRVKEDHEAELFEKFSRLINSKKLKIRNQQRLLNKFQTPQDDRGALWQPSVSDTDDKLEITSEESFHKPDKRKSLHEDQYDQARESAASSDTDSTANGSRYKASDDEEMLTTDENHDITNISSVQHPHRSREIRGDNEQATIKTLTTQPPPKRYLPFEHGRNPAIRPFLRKDGVVQSSTRAANRTGDHSMDDQSGDEL